MFYVRAGVVCCARAPRKIVKSVVVAGVVVVRSYYRARL